MPDNWEKHYVYDGAIHLRTYTKSYGLPGIRIGYFLDPYGKMRNVKMPWSIGAIGKAFIEKILQDDRQFLKESMPKIWEEKKFVSKIPGVKTAANFCTVKVKNKDKLLTELMRNNMMVRNCASFGLPEYVRVSTKKPKEDRKLIKIIKSYLY